ncbi:hypothetical protein [Companilactobacillus halodurans]|uniref:Bacterial archaeo-eukaryotic release factor family 8 domain-containing protein n=1 Tax=Companilactobacillus halodurans TaxID=2584183 RepID=A0A5P0ZTQ4_9LACO|nr:hypothetical protein [Companilactobacillus halodurans]MQS76971.1 hypothetical protein [Companilactobacillus halodurans]MQS96387.1 hypothetical protein [Companilactobacillus halodurans]
MKLQNKRLMKLLASKIEPKVSIILPIHQGTPQIDENILTYKNLLKCVKKQLELNYPRRLWNQLVEKLESLVLDRELWHNEYRSLLIFGNDEGLEICQMRHAVLPKEHVGNTFLVQDLLLPEENKTSADYLINLSRDRINVFDIQTLKQVEIPGLYLNFADYYSDFDANSNLNSGSYGGLQANFHGHRSKSEEQQKDQLIYYQYLDQSFNELYRNKGYTFVLAGLPEVVNVFLNEYQNRNYIDGVMHVSVLNYSHQQFENKMKEFFSFEKVATIEKIKREFHQANEQNRVINDIAIIDFALNNHDVKSLVSFNDGSSYSIAHNKLLIKSLINKINCLVLYLPSAKNYSSINAILY